MNKKLTPKQERFVAEYIKDMNATQAAIRAGYSQRSAGQTGHRLKNNETIRARVRELLVENTMTPEEVAYRLTAQARASMRDFVDTNTYGAAVDLAKAQKTGALDYVTRLSFDGKTGQVVDIQLYDSQKALHLIGKLYAMFADTVKHEHSFERELEAAGFDASETFEQLVAAFAASLADEQD